MERNVANIGWGSNPRFTQNTFSAAEFCPLNYVCAPAHQHMATVW